MNFLKNKTGQIALTGGPLALTIGIIVALFVIAILTGALALGLQGMNDSIPATSVANNLTKAVFENASAGVLTFSTFQGVLWVMAAVGALLAIVGAAVIGVLFVQSRK